MRSAYIIKWRVEKLHNIIKMQSGSDVKSITLNELFKHLRFIINSIEEPFIGFNTIKDYVTGRSPMFDRLNNVHQYRILNGLLTHYYQKNMEENKNA